MTLGEYEEQVNGIPCGKPLPTAIYVHREVLVNVKGSLAVKAATYGFTAQKKGEGEFTEHFFQVTDDLLDGYGRVYGRPGPQFHTIKSGVRTTGRPFTPLEGMNRNLVLALKQVGGVGDVQDGEIEAATGITFLSDDQLLGDIP